MEEKIIKQFEERFHPNGDEWSYLHTKDIYQYPEPDEIRDFLKDTIKQVREDERKAIREMIEGKKKNWGYSNRLGNVVFTEKILHHNQALDEILSDPLLKEDEQEAS